MKHTQLSEVVTKEVVILMTFQVQKEDNITIQTLDTATPSLM